MFYGETKCEDKIELSMKTINGEKLDKYPILSGPGIKGRGYGPKLVAIASGRPNNMTSPTAHSGCVPSGG